jgi:hypothetical protein
MAAVGVPSCLSAYFRCILIRSFVGARAYSQSSGCVDRVLLPAYKELGCRVVADLERIAERFPHATWR